MFTESLTAYQGMVAYHEQRKAIREGAARKEREMLDAMTPEQRAEYWEARKIRAIEDHTNALRDAAAANRSLASAPRRGNGGMGFGLGVVLGVALGNGGQ